jgi:hypothetical protein
MRKGNLTRQQAIEIAGLAAVEKVEKGNCEPTNRVQTDGDTSTEWAASLILPDGDVLVAYYYTTPEQNEIMGEHDGDGSCIDWEISGYEII